MSELSHSISKTLSLLKSVQKEYDTNFEIVGKMDLLTQNYLHSLEFDNLKYEERAKLATALMRCRNKRRIAKDIVLRLEPAMAYFKTDNGKVLTKSLGDLHGRLLSVEKGMENRRYVPRIKDGDCE